MGKKSNAQPESVPDHPKDEVCLQTVISKRIALFESIKAQQLAHRQSIAGDPIKITLMNGDVKEGKKWISTPLDIAKEMTKGWATNALISKVNGVLWDMSRPLEGDCDMVLFKFDSDEGRDTFWHSSAHILGQGFYYDAFYGDLGLNEDHFKRIDSGAAKAVGKSSLLIILKLQGTRLLRCFLKINLRLKSLMNYLKTKLSQYTDVAP